MFDVFEVAAFAQDSHDVLRSRITPGSGVLPALRIPGRTDSLFALSEAGDFYLLLQLSRPLKLAERRLNVLSVSAGSEFVIEDDDAIPLEEKAFAAVVLERGNDDLLAAFGSMVGILLGALPTEPGNGDLEEFLDDFLKLFAPRSSVDRSAVVGLWGELWLIHSASDPVTLARGWHLETTARFDFSFGDFRIEVKTSERALRIHPVGLSQLEAQTKPTWLASILVTSDASGMSVTELLSEILNALPVDDRMATVRKALAILSGDMEAASDFRFSPSGENPLALIPAADIPRVIIPDGAAITDVTFSVDVTNQALTAARTLQALLS